MAAAGADANGAEAEQAGQEQVPGPELEAAVLKDAVRTLLAAEASPRSHCNFLCKGSALWSDRGSPGRVLWHLGRTWKFRCVVVELSLDAPLASI